MTSKEHDVSVSRPDILQVLTKNFLPKNERETCGVRIPSRKLICPFHQGKVSFSRSLSNLSFILGRKTSSEIQRAPAVIHPLIPRRIEESKKKPHRGWKQTGLSVVLLVSHIIIKIKDKELT